MDHLQFGLLLQLGISQGVLLGPYKVSLSRRRLVVPFQFLATWLVSMADR